MPSLLRKFTNYPYLMYLLRCIIGFLIGYSLMLLFPEHDFFWTLLSIILVISPDENDARKITVERVKSNLIGSISGLIVFFLPVDTIYKVVIGIVITVLVCQYFRLINVARSAIVAVIIILVEPHTEIVLLPIDRFLAVALGCVIGLLVTLVTSFLKNSIIKR